MLNIDLNAYAKQSAPRTAETKQDPPPETFLDFNHAPPQADDLGQPDPVLKVEQMTICQHGQPCLYLHHQPPERAVCQHTNKPVWDLKECPKGYWWPMHETATD